MRTWSSYKTSGDFHKKYCSALRKCRFCKPTFLDEFAEFERRVIEALRQPLEDKVVTISRARATLNFPAQIMLIAAMNPCPCGNLNSAKQCICTSSAIERYKRKISGPIIDRIDIWLGVYSIAHHKLEDDSPADKKRESSATVQKRVEAARKIQEQRFKDNAIRTNAEMSVRDIKKYCTLDAESKSILQQAAARLDLSPRAYHRVIKLARTIADLEDASSSRHNTQVLGGQIKKEHLLEALQYRPMQQG